MYEYKVESYPVRDAEKSMNILAAEGWFVVAVCSDIEFGAGIIVVYEREKT